MIPLDQDIYDAEFDLEAIEEVAGDFVDWFMVRQIVWLWIASSEYKFYRANMLRIWSQIFGKSR